jgi:hypothetical protein
VSAAGPLEADAGPSRWPFAPGAAPFRANGIVYKAALLYVKKRTPGGREALRAVLDDADGAFLDRIFLPGTLYDIGPLVRASVAAAHIEGTPIDAFVRARGRESADMDIRGVYKLMLSVASPELLASRLPWAFNRYFEPTRAEMRSRSPGRVEAELQTVPACVAGWYAWATEGFVGKALELANARDVRFRWDPPAPGTPTAGVPAATLPFGITWAG